MTRRLREAWESSWHGPGRPETLTAVRVLLALHALWLLLSRPDIPQLAAWPREFWTPAAATMGLRFGIGLLPASAERGLFVVLHLALACSALGIATRAACAVSAVLLYHFAPFEEILVGMPHTFFGGLTVGTVGLGILAFADLPRRGAAASAEYRWPVSLIRLLFSFNYFSAFLAKLYYSGPAWFTGHNLHAWAVGAGTISGAPGARLLAGSAAACWAIAIATGLLESLFPLAVFSRRAALVLVPMAFVGHIGIVYTLGIFFPSFPLLLLFAEWPGSLAARVPAAAEPSPE